MSKVDKCRYGEGEFKLWTSTNCSSLDNYCDLLLPGNMAQNYGIKNMVVYTVILTFMCFTCLCTFNRLKD